MLLAESLAGPFPVCDVQPAVPVACGRHICML
jgi:hypothetical protein